MSGRARLARSCCEIAAGIRKNTQELITASRNISSTDYDGRQWGQEGRIGWEG
jgi:hypothetical protein